jgi:hypothetical protein
MVSCGQPWSTCHHRFGRLVTTVTAPPTHSMGRRSISLGPTASTAPMRTIQKTATRSLTCMDTAVARPAMSSSRSCRVRAQRTSSQVISVQTKESMTAVFNVLAVKRTPQDTA